MRWMCFPSSLRSSAAIRADKQDAQINGGCGFEAGFCFRAARLKARGKSIKNTEGQGERSCFQLF